MAMELPSTLLTKGRKSLQFEKKMMLQKISAMENLPVPNHHVMQIMLLLRNEDINMRELINSIEKDQSLVAKILKLVNSGYYGLRKSIDCVERAVNLLGILNIKQLVYSATILDLFTEKEKIEWNHAHSTSVLMGNLLRENDIPAASNLPLTMLMHDIGKVVLRRFSPRKYEMTIMQSERDQVPLFEAENAVIWINHAEAGSLLLEKWEMTEDTIFPVMYHHSSEIPEDYVLETALVQFVNWIDCRARGINCPVPNPALLAEAGFEQVDNSYWIDYQKEMIVELDAPLHESHKDHASTDTESLSAAPLKDEFKKMKSPTGTKRTIDLDRSSDSSTTPRSKQPDGTLNNSDNLQQLEADSDTKKIQTDNLEITSATPLNIDSVPQGASESTGHQNSASGTQKISTGAPITDTSTTPLDIDSGDSQSTSAPLPRDTASGTQKISTGKPMTDTSTTPLELDDTNADRSEKGKTKKLFRFFTHK